MDFIILIKIIISLSILNVWIMRYNKKTKYRGGNANSLKEEFEAYGLPTWLMYVVGFLKISLAFMILAAIWITQITLYAAVSMSILMVSAIIMHIKIKDPLKKSLPALSILLLLLALCMESMN